MESKQGNKGKIDKDNCY